MESPGPGHGHRGFLVQRNHESGVIVIGVILPLGAALQQRVEATSCNRDIFTILKSGIRSPTQNQIRPSTLRRRGGINDSLGRPLRSRLHAGRCLPLRAFSRRAARTGFQRTRATLGLHLPFARKVSASGAVRSIAAHLVGGLITFRCRRCNRASGTRNGQKDAHGIFTMMAAYELRGLDWFRQAKRETAGFIPSAMCPNSSVGEKGARRARQ
jgi:hypothetical protein